MDYKDRNGNIVFNNTMQDKILKNLYSSYFGKILLKALTLPNFSKAVGVVLNSKPSSILVDPFIKLNKVDMNDFEKKNYSSFNDFFTRKVKTNMRPIEMNNKSLISPCDGHLTALKITKNLNFVVKNAAYSVNSLLKDKKLASAYIDGHCLIFRLSMEDYHRYCYIDNLKKSNNRKIAGILHTVNPLVSNFCDVYKENSREYCLMETENFGNIVQVEVGALLVGKINNFHKKGEFTKGSDKGMFELGGSTIVLLIEKDKVLIDNDILVNTEDGIETLVKLGEKIGVSL